MKQWYMLYVSLYSYPINGRNLSHANATDIGDRTE